MRRPRILCRAWIAVAAVVTAVSALPAASWQDIDWHDDAGGYREALEEADRTGTRMFVYFYTEWCPYCRQFNSELLGDPRVQGQIGEMLAVRVNPERGPDERSLASHYRVRGYPALFVYTPQGRGKFEPLRRTVPTPEGRPRLKTPEEFAATLRGGG
jgi:thiol:disulfide interchange protein